MQLLWWWRRRLHTDRKCLHEISFLFYFGKTFRLHFMEVITPVRDEPALKINLYKSSIKIYCENSAVHRKWLITKLVCVCNIAGMSWKVRRKPPGDRQLSNGETLLHAHTHRDPTQLLPRAIGGGEELPHARIFLTSFRNLSPLRGSTRKHHTQIKMLFIIHLVTFVLDD